MPQTPPVCDLDLLRRSLTDRLSEIEEEALGQHLAHCESCRLQLESLAGRQEDWSRISLALQRELADRPIPPCDSPRPDHDPDEEDGDSPADFVVDFLEPATTPEAIGRLGEIEILELIGRGGMGVVLKGYQPELKRIVAVKVLAPHLAVSGAARRRFAREAQAVAAILHPNVMPILTVHSPGKLPYLVMPFLACESLQQRIEQHGPLETIDILRIGLQTANGLAAAHAQGIVHRDVKPANILLERGVDRVMLTDFGLARAMDDAQITRTGLIAGTPPYMSPEQVRGEPLDARSDLFSLGSVLYTMATGRPPFRAESTYGILRRITDVTPRAMRDINPQVPVWLERLVGRLLAKSREARYRSADEVGRLLEQCLAHLQQPEAAPLPGALADRPPLATTPTDHVRGRVKSSAWIATGLATMAFLGWQLHSRLAPNTPPPDQSPGQARTTRDDTTTQPVATLGNDSADTPSLSLDVPADLDTAWDASAATLQELIEEGAEFVTRTQRDWDHNAQATGTPGSSPFSERRHTPLDQDIRP